MLTPEHTNLADEKCLVIMKGLTSCFVIDAGSIDTTIYRLPLLSEISREVIKKHSLSLVGNNLHLLITEEEQLSPWDLLDPFPPHNYHDFNHMELLKLEDDCWELLNQGDKELITNCHKALKLLIT